MTTKARWLLLISVAISVCAYGAEKKVTLEGQLVSASCYLSDGATGNDMGGTKECGSGCLRQGKPGGLLTKENSFYILDGPSLRLAPYVGQEIRVTGEEHGRDIISIRSASVRKGGGWESIDIQYHPEK
ncbi:MAG TPA: hypothetical protein VFB28_11915 [Terriglobales bacterium]|nr:hypothetical protein [Terriglobales bacterium]